MTLENNIYILNLCNELSEALLGYFDKIEATVVERNEIDDIAKIQFVLVPSLLDIKATKKELSLEKARFIVVGNVFELKDFLLNNGRLCINDEFLNSNISEYVLNKFFKQNYNIHLDESFSTEIEEVKSIKITNHLRIGLDIDLISTYAFSRDFNLVSLRSFIDHTIYYLVYLKQAGLSGVPFEIEYGANDNFFIVNIHAAVKNFVAEYMIDSFGHVNSNDPLNYLLGVIARSCDFLDTTYIENPGKIVLTAFFAKSDEKRIRGFAFNNIETTAQVLAQLDEKVKAFETIDKKSDELGKESESNKDKKLPGNLVEIINPKNENSILNREKEKVEDLVEFTLEDIETKFPDLNIADFSREELDEVLDSYEDEGFVQGLSDTDKDEIVERIQKNNMIEAYNEELERVRGEIVDDDEIKEVLQDTLTEEVAERVTSQMDANIINKILGSDDDDDESQQIDGFVEEELSQKVKGTLDDGAPAIKVSGSSDDDENATVVKGGKEAADDFMAIVSSMGDEDKSPLITSFSSSFEDNSKKGLFQFKSSEKSEIDKGMNLFVKSTLDSNPNLKDIDPKVKAFIHKEAPDKLRVGLDRFAQKLGQTVDSLSENDLLKFKEIEIPKIMTEVMDDPFSIEEFKSELENAGVKNIDVSNGKQVSLNVDPTAGMSKAFKSKFKKNLESKLEDRNDVEKVDNHYVVSDNQVSDEEMQVLIKETMQETFEDEFKFSNASKDQIEEKEEQIVKELSTTLDMQEEDVRSIVKGASQKAKEKELDIVTSKLQDTFLNTDDDNENTDELKNQSFAETAMIEKLKKIEEENAQLKRSLDAYKVKDESEGAVKGKIDEISEKASNEAQKEIEQQAETDSNVKSVISDDEKNQLQEKLNKGEPLTAEESEKLAQAMENEKKIVALAKEAQAQLKKMQVEVGKKESLFQSELGKAQKALKAKDMVLDKAKDSMKNIVIKKEKELHDAQAQIQALNQRVNSNDTAMLANRVKTLEKERESLSKTADVYKGKLESMAKQISAKSKDDNSALLSEENRNLKKMKVQLENKLNADSKMKRSLEDRYQKAKASENKHRNEATQLQAKFKNFETQIKVLKDQNSKLEKAKNVLATATDSKASKEIDLLKGQNSKLQTKINDLNKKLVDSSKVKSPDVNKTLEAEVQKYKNSLATSLKEIEKLKNDNQTLSEKVSAAVTTSEGSGDSSKVQELESTNKELNDKIQALSAKLKETMSEAKKASSAENGSANEKRLEQSVKKLNSELTKAKSELAEKKKDQIKHKNEVTKLKNQIQKLTKDLERSKPKGGKKKAA